MTRSSWVYDPDKKTLVPKHEFVSPTREAGYVVLGDQPDFVSPIDGKLYSGRAGMREHCRIHDVVPNAELKGLPPLTSQADQRSSSEIRRDNEARKSQIIRQVNRHIG